MSWFGWFRRSRSDKVTQGVDLGEGAPTFLLGGRQLVRGVPYLLPKDLEEGNRLDFQHFILRYALQGNYATPLRSHSSILDVGTGIWAREMAQVFPGANIVGLDVVPPPTQEVPMGSTAASLHPAN